MATDFSVFDKLKTKADYDQTNQVFQLQKAQAQAAIDKANKFDLDDAGEQVLYKAAQGLPLTPQEQAIGQAYDAKRQTTQWNPVTGNMYTNKASFAGLGGNSAPAGNAAPMANPAGFSSGGGSSNPPALPPAFDGGSADPFEAQFNAQMQAAAGNFKMQQEIKKTYLESKMKFNEDQAKSAGFTDRMNEAEPVIEEKQAAGTSYLQNLASKVPVVGNALVSDDYQQLDQAQRNFINAQLRRESGAAISPSEFENARKQYFPQPGDYEATLQQKSQNRATSGAGMQRASGPAYIPPRSNSAKKSAPSAPTIKDGATATNPQTGEKMIYVKGKWMKV